MKRSSTILTAGFLLATVTVAVVAFAGPPTNRFTPNRSAAGSSGAPPTTRVAVPNDGDISASSFQSVVIVPGGNRPPRADALLERQPVVSVQTLAYGCDAGQTQCSFGMMPHYAQTNPNLAYINVPPAVYKAESVAPNTGWPAGWFVQATDGVPVAVWDTAATPQAWALTFMSTNWKPPVSGILDPFYASWLPLGPVSPKDTGNIRGFWYTALCPATSSSMMLMAGLAARSPKTQVKPGSWVDVSFNQAKKPPDCNASGGPSDCQDPIGLPLEHDHSTLAPNRAQMTAQEIQRVVNMAIKLKNDPIAGGTAHWDFIKDDFTSTESGHPNPFTAVCASSCSPPYTTDVIADLIKKKTVVGLWFGDYTVNIATSKDKSGKVLSKTATFTQTGGHTVAVEGFTGGGSSNPALILYDPVYANTLQRPIVVAAPAPYLSSDGVPLHVTFPMGTELATIKYNGDEAISNVSQLKDGQLLTVITGYHAFHLD